MPNRGDRYVVQVKPSHIKWGEYRNPTNRAVIQGESYVKIPAGPARAPRARRSSRPRYPPISFMARADSLAWVPSIP